MITTRIISFHMYINQRDGEGEGIRKHLFLLILLHDLGELFTH